MSTVRDVQAMNASFEQEVAQMFLEHSRLVYRTAYSVTGSAQDAEDVVQNLFLRLLREFPPGLRQNPKGYLYRAAVNLSLNALKSKRRQMAVAGDACWHAHTDRPRAATDIQGRLLEVIAQLKPRTVEMLILRYEHDYSDAEIAGLLGCSRGLVAVALYRARAQLRKLMRPQMNAAMETEKK